MKKNSLILVAVFLSCCSASLSFSQPILVDLILDLTPEILLYDNKEFARLLYVEYDIVRPGEMFLGTDRKPGTSDDFLYDPDGPDAYEGAYKWEIDLLYASSNIAANNYDPSQQYYGLGWYDGGGITSWFIPTILSFESIDAGHGNAWDGSWIYFPYYGYSQSVVFSSSISPYCSPVPEPSTALLVTLGLIVLSGKRKFSHK